MEWEYWNQDEADIIHALKFQERKLRMLLARHFPDEEKKLRVIYKKFPLAKNRIMAYAYTDEGIIEINKHYVFSIPLEETVDTLRHEFAHVFSVAEIGDVWIKRKGKKFIGPIIRTGKSGAVF